MADPIQFKPELWKTLELKRLAETEESGPSPVKSFFDSQNPEETYEIRGILPRFKAQD